MEPDIWVLELHGWSCWSIAKLVLQMASSIVDMHEGSIVRWGATMCTKMSRILIFKTTLQWSISEKTCMIHILYICSCHLTSRTTGCFAGHCTRIEWICHLWALHYQQLPHALSLVIWIAPFSHEMEEFNYSQGWAQEFARGCTLHARTSIH